MEIKIIKNKKKLKEILEFPLSLVITAKRQSGKSVLLRKMIDAIHKDYSYVYIMCPTACLSKDWDEYKKKKYKDKFEFNDEPKKEDIEDLFDTMLDMKKAKLRMKKKFNDKILIVCDDLTELYDNRRAGDIFNKLATKGRHVNISYILTNHLFKWLPRGMRVNSGQKIFFNTGNAVELEQISQECATATANEDEVRTAIQTHAKDYNALMIQDGAAESKFFLLSRDIK